MYGSGNISGQIMAQSSIRLISWSMVLCYIDEITPLSMYVWHIAIYFGLSEKLCPGNKTCNFPDGECDFNEGQCVCKPDFSGDNCESKLYLTNK